MSEDAHTRLARCALGCQQCARVWKVFNTKSVFDPCCMACFFSGQKWPPFKNSLAENHTQQSETVFRLFLFRKFAIISTRFEAILKFQVYQKNPLVPPLVIFSFLWGSISRQPRVRGRSYSGSTMCTRMPTMRQSLKGFQQEKYFSLLL